MIDFLSSLFFESVLLLIIFVVVVMAIALGIDRQRMTAASRRGVWLTAIACALLFVVQFLVKTDRERIQATVAEMARAIDEGDVATLGEHLDQDFQDRGLDKSEWLADIRQRLQRWRIDEAKVGGFNTKVEGDNATVAFGASCDWRGGEQAQQSVNSTWRLAFVRRSDGWKLQKVLSAKFGPGGMLDYAAILQY